jgi:hypothetical protein
MRKLQGEISWALFHHQMGQWPATAQPSISPALSRSFTQEKKGRRVCYHFCALKPSVDFPISIHTCSLTLFWFSEHPHMPPQGVYSFLLSNPVPPFGLAFAPSLPLPLPPSPSLPERKQIIPSFITSSPATLYYAIMCQTIPYYAKLPEPSPPHLQPSIHEPVLLLTPIYPLFLFFLLPLRNGWRRYLSTMSFMWV